jgi:amino acid adenylation domain-containing protein
MVFQNKLSESLKIFGNKTAIKCQQEIITYDEVWERANAIGTFLLNKGLKKGTVVSIYLDNRCDIIYSMIGIANAQCVFAPIDTALPVKRLENIMQELSPGCLIASKDRLPGNNWLASSCSVFFIEDMMLAEKSVIDDIQWPSYQEDDALYIYFTSGSTGKPKGIVGKNESLLHFIDWEISAFRIEPGFQFSQFISPYFDAFLRDVFTPLMSGGTICIPPQYEGFLCEDNMVTWIEQMAISLIHCVPSLFRLISNGPIVPESLPSLKYVLMSGEKIIPAELKHWYDVFRNRIQLVNLYGATEATLISSYYLIQPDDVAKGRIFIGSPIADTELWVANKQLKACNPLEPGDLYIISNYLSKGYLNAPGLNAEKFIKVMGDKTAYKTGDKARIFPGGSIDLIGREDRQVKLRGIRVELEEIENTLVESGLVKSAVVVKHTDDKNNEMLLAYFIKRETGSHSISVKNALEHYLQDRLPQYMQPADLIELEQFPLLSNGKINHAKLQEYSNVTVKTKPVDETEARLMSIWKEILGDKELSTEDVFYKSGGNSISIMRLISLIYRDFSVRVLLSELFNNPTIKKQAALIRVSVKNNLMRIPRAAIKDAYNVSAVQERLYYNYELNKRSLSYNLPMIWEIDANAGDEKVEHVIRQLIERHESFRTSFKMDNGTIIQVINPNVAFVLEKVNVEGDEFDTAIAETIRPFDLSKAPLLRATVLQNDTGRRMLVIDIHHIICDGMSQWILGNDFVKLYQGQELAPLLIQSKDYAEWETNYRASTAYNDHRDFWLKSFAGKIPVLKLPTKYTGNGSFSEMGGEVFFVMNKGVVETIAAQLQKKEITTFSILLSLYFIYLVQLTGQEDLVVGIATTGRVQHELDELISMFVKTLPIRYHVNPDDRFTDFVAGLHDHLVQAYNNQLYDLSDIVDAAQATSAEERNLFNTMFVLHNFAVNRQDVDSDKFTPYKFENPAPKYPISLRVVEDEHVFNFRLEYSTQYFTKWDIEILVSQFQQLVQLISGNPNASIAACISNVEKPMNVSREDIVFNF